MFKSLCAVLTIGALAFSACAADGPLHWSNPILPQRADPHVWLNTDGYYYLTATVPEYDRIELRRAKTLAQLSTATAKVIWRKHEQGPMGAHIWAPEIHFIDGKWYVYFAAGRADDVWAIRMYVLENDSANPLEGDWTEKGQIKMNWESFTLDATTFAHRGERYLVWAQSVPERKGTSLFIAKMDTPWSISGTQVCITKPELPWERIGHNVNEAPAVIHKNGRLFMTYSASATDANYCLGLLTADENADLLNPESWRKSPEPVFKSSPATGQFGPGHNCFTTMPDGQTDIMVYHARNYEKIEGEPLHNPDRATRAQVLNWKTDGTPDFGVPVADDRRPVYNTGGNPIIDNVFTADPAPLVYKDKVYLYVGQDEGDGKGYRMPRWRVYATSDMVNWTDEGAPLTPADFKWSTGGPTSGAGHVIEKNGKFHWYVTVDHRDVHGKAIGVAVSDSPTGPFKDAREKALITNDMTKETKISWDDIDPAAFIDDDGQAWLFWGNQKCYYAKLKDNLIELDGPIHVVPDAEVGNRFTEAPWIHKRNGLYYLSYATGFPEKTAYSVADKITGPWKYKGLVAEGAQNSNTIHQGIITFKGKDYFFYHSGMIQHDQGAGRGKNGGGSYLRSVCIDYLYYNPDGTMKRVVQTSEGVAATE